MFPSGLRRFFHHSAPGVSPPSPTLSAVGLFKLRHSGRYEAASRDAFHSRLPDDSSLGAFPHI